MAPPSPFAPGTSRAVSKPLILKLIPPAQTTTGLSESCVDPPNWSDTDFDRDDYIAELSESEPERPEDSIEMDAGMMYRMKTYLERREAERLELLEPGIVTKAAVPAIEQSQANTSQKGARPKEPSSAPTSEGKQEFS